jgi:AmmeMemoRadiSam system protein B
MADNYRRPVVSGAFYPGDKSSLSKDVRLYLSKADVPEPSGELLTLVVPHAGYMYSGQVAAFAYKLLENRQFDTAILVGASHRVAVRGAAVFPSGSFGIPTGVLEVDEEAASALMQEDKRISRDLLPHRDEHCLEVQLPFLVETLASVKIVPVLLGSPSLDIGKALGKAIAKVMKGRKVVLLASTDLSHYYDYSTAMTLDREAIKAVEAMDVEGFYESVRSGRCELCGASAVLSAMAAVNELGAARAQLLKYANSGDVTGDRRQVVGYASMAFLSS